MQLSGYSREGFLPRCPTKLRREIELVFGWTYLLRSAWRGATQISVPGGGINWRTQSPHWYRRLVPLGNATIQSRSRPEVGKRFFFSVYEGPNRSCKPVSLGYDENPILKTYRQNSHS